MKPDEIAWTQYNSHYWTGSFGGIRFRVYRDLKSRRYMLDFSDEEKDVSHIVTSKYSLCESAKAAALKEYVAWRLSQ